MILALTKTESYVHKVFHKDMARLETGLIDILIMIAVGARIRNKEGSWRGAGAGGGRYETI